MAEPEARPVVGNTLGGVTSDGTGWLLAGAIIGGLAAFGFQVVGTRALGDQAFAPIATLWTIQYLVWSVILFTVETLVVRETMPGRLGRATLRGAMMRIWGWIAGAALSVTTVCWFVRERLFYGVGDLAFVAGAIVLGFGALAIVRGTLAGSGRYRAYGLVSGAESVLRLAFAVAISIVGASTRALAWTLPVGAAVAASSWIASQAASQRHARAIGTTRASTSPDRPRVVRFLLATTLANGAAQLLLAGGPVAMVALSAPAEELSVFFVTLTAARVPIVVALGGLLSRLLPIFDGIITRRGRSALPRLAASVAAATAVVAGVGAVAALVAGGRLIGALFGAQLAPPGWLAAAATGGVVLATGGMVLNQLLIADGREQLLFAPWGAGLAVAIASVAIIDGDASLRVGASFVVGEVAALVALLAVAGLAVRTHREK